MPTLDRITIYPVKSLDGIDLEEAVLLPSGGLEHDRRWQLVDTNGLADWEMRGFGCEPVFAERKPMAEDVAAKLFKQAKGVSLVRAVEAWHSIN